MHYLVCSALFLTNYLRAIKSRFILSVKQGASVWTKILVNQLQFLVSSQHDAQYFEGKTNYK